MNEPYYLTDKQNQEYEEWLAQQNDDYQSWGGNMNALEVKVLEVTPAVVKFNYSEMLEIAKEIKSEYEGLTFTEETVKQGKSTVAEIKKIQKSVNDFKIKTKKEFSIYLFF